MKKEQKTINVLEILNTNVIEQIKTEADKLNSSQLEEYSKTQKELFENKDVVENDKLLRAVSDVYALDVSLDNLKTINEIVNLDKSNSYVEEYLAENDIFDYDTLWDIFDQKLQKEGMSDVGLLYMSEKLVNKINDDNECIQINAYQNDLNVLKKSEVIEEILDSLTLDLKEKQTSNNTMIM
ncbi:Uncharacterised protein [Mycoplasmopsis columboralis]|uniref:Uncharacterized protein n=2 Tax=Mycoplasmopsis columboralis TaxID=171282 RepID=A0A449B6M2_9BACT|nr:hypothetical protein [Mycoplasmopsis columboralis]VEU76229.1 Uncharacterised protein [Mycoplasmopsis columboralis]